MKGAVFINPYNIGILLFNEVEVLDFAGPFEVFSLAEHPATQEKAFKVHTISQNGQIIHARNGLQVLAEYSFNNHPNLDYLIIPGGYGAEAIEIHNKAVIDWLTSQSKEVKMIASVCTGAFLLAEAGILENKKATTHWMDIERLEADYPEIAVQRNQKYVDEGKVITSGGISAGIHMSLYLVSKIISKQVAIDTAKRMEYDFELQ